MVLPVGIVAGAVACWALSAVAMAQDVPPPAKDPPSLQELAKTHKNPFAQSVNVPFEFATGFRGGVRAPHRREHEHSARPAVLADVWLDPDRAPVALRHV